MQKRHLVVTLSILLFGAVAILAVSLFKRNYVQQQPDNQENSIVFLGEPDKSQNKDLVMEQGRRSNATAIDPMSETGEPLDQSSIQSYEGRTITFDQMCRAFPTTLSIDRRTVLKFDNRSDQWLSISLGTRMTSIRPFGNILALFNKEGSILVHCNDEENVAIIEVK